jgi:hypothetical protein
MLAAVQPRNSADAGSVPGVDLEPLYSPEQIAAYLGIDVTSVRRRFVDIKGVIVMGRAEAHGAKRSYTTIRIPRSVLEKFIEQHKRKEHRK